MTAKPKPVYTCAECRLTSPGWHYTDDLEPRAYRCPQYTATMQQQAAQALVADAHTEAFKAAKEIIADAAARMVELSANLIRDELEAAQISGPVVGAAFSASVREGVLEATGRTVPSTDPGTHKHRIYVYRSLRYGQRRTA